MTPGEMKISEFDSERSLSKEDPMFPIKIMSNVDLKSDDRLAIRSDVMEFGWEPLPPIAKWEIGPDHPVFFIVAAIAVLNFMVAMFAAIYYTFIAP